LSAGYSRDCRIDRENQRLIAKNLQLTAELARLRGLPDVEQLTFSIQHDLQQTRTQIFQRPAAAPTPSAPAPRRPQPGHGPREQPTLPVVEIRHELPADQWQCPACGGELTEMADQADGTEVAAVFYTLCETARLIGVDPRAYLLHAVYAAIDQPGTVTFPEDLIPSSTTN
jgi:hypothetical protein